MSTGYADHFSVRKGRTSQRQAMPGREAEQVKNHAGGFVFQVDDWARLDRFLIIGSEGNTYYASEKKMTVDNAQAVVRCIQQDGPRVVARVVEISDAGRAPKNDPALFVLALCAAAAACDTRQAALRALPKVARIGTHLFHFASMVQGQRGWGRALRRAVGDWYNALPVERLIEQVSKYQQRDGWSNRDLLRLSHPKTTDNDRKAVYDWACGRKDGEYTPGYLRAIDVLRENPRAEAAVDTIIRLGLPRECIPTDLLNDADVWAALLQRMPLQAMVRNLGKMSAIGLLKPLARENNRVVAALSDKAALHKSRLHPMALLLANKIYAQGRGEKGSLTWTAVPQIVDALEEAFYMAFKNVTPTGKRILIGVDVSASMTSEFIGGTPLSACEASAALAMTVARTEKNYHLFAFNDRFQEVPITANSSMQDVLKHTRAINGGGTDCALPMIYADERGLEVDAFVVLTDNETHSGRHGHAAEALRDYRRNSGINAKLIVVGMTSTGFSIADPKDAGMLDVVGFDSAAPQIIADFIRG